MELESELDLAIRLSTRNNTDETLQLDLDMNEANIRGLLEEIKELKKELRKMERDYDVLYFDYQMVRTDEPPDTRKGKCMAIE
jgi:hypothetical protein